MSQTLSRSVSVPGCRRDRVTLGHPARDGQQSAHRGLLGAEHADRRHRPDDHRRRDRAASVRAPRPGGSDEATPASGRGSVASKQAGQDSARHRAGNGTPHVQGIGNEARASFHSAFRFRLFSLVLLLPYCMYTHAHTYIYTHARARVLILDKTNCFQLSHALQRQKTLFDNVNIDWNLSHDEGSTDFSDDETIIEDRVSGSRFHNTKPTPKENNRPPMCMCAVYSRTRMSISQNGCLTPEKKSRSRPPSYAGGGGTGSGDSPVTLRSRSSTCDSLQSGSSPSASTNRQQMPPPPPPQARKPVAGKLSTQIPAENLL